MIKHLIPIGSQCAIKGTIQTSYQHFYNKSALVLYWILISICWLNMVTHAASSGNLTRVSNVSCGGYIAAHSGSIWVNGIMNSEGNLYRYNGHSTHLVDGVKSMVLDLKVIENDLWICAEKGLYRWDGISLRQIPNITGIISSVVSDGKVLWIGTSDGIFTWDGYSVKNILSTSSCVTDVWLNDNLIWYSTIGGLYTWDNGHVTAQASPEFTHALIKYGSDLWIATSSALYRWNGKSLQTVSGLRDDEIIETCISNGTLWLGAANGDLYRAEDDKIELVATLDGSIQKMVAINNDIWISIYPRDKPCGQEPLLYRWDGHSMDRLTVKTGTVWSILRFQDSVMVGTDCGLYQWDGHTLSTIHGVKKVMTLQPLNGKLWIGTQNGIYRWSPVQGKQK